MIGWMFDQAIKWVAGFVKDMLNTVWKLLTATLFHLPDVTGLPQVQDLTAKSLTVVNVCYVLFIMAAGVVAMTHGSIQARHSAGELLPRLCLGLVVANFGTWICQQVIGFGNALVLALTGQGIASDKTMSVLLGTILGEITNPAALLLSVVLGLAIAVLVLLLLVGWIVRFAVLIIVCGTAPLALACHGLPWTDPLAQLWWKTLGGVTATVVLQAVTLHTSLSILLNPASNLAGIGWPFDPSGVLNLLVVAVLLWVTVRIPGAVKQYVSGSRGRPNVMGTIVRLVIVQQFARGLGGLARGGRGFRGSGGHRPGAGPGTGPGGPGSPGPGPASPPTPSQRPPGRAPGRPAGQPARPGGTGAGAGSGRAGARAGSSARPFTARPVAWSRAPAPPAGPGADSRAPGPARTPSSPSPATPATGGTGWPGRAPGPSGTGWPPAPKPAAPRPAGGRPAAPRSPGSPAIPRNPRSRRSQ